MAPLHLEDGRPPLHPGSPSSQNVYPPLSPASMMAVSRKSFLSMPPLPQRGVQFFPLTEIVDVLSVDDYTEEEVASVWYNDEELETFKQNGVEGARRLSRGGLRRGESGRGLEQLTPAGYQETTAARINSVLAVLSQQDHLVVSDQERLAQAYRPISQICALKALDKAAVDEHDAKLYYEDDPYKDDTDDDDESAFECWLLSPSKWFAPFSQNRRVAPIL